MTLTNIQKFTANQHKALYGLFKTLPSWVSLTTLSFVALLYALLLVPMLSFAVFCLWSGTVYDVYNSFEQNDTLSNINLMLLAFEIILDELTSLSLNSAELQTTPYKHCDLIIRHFCITSPATGATLLTAALALIIGMQYFWNWYYALVNKHKNLILVMPMQTTLIWFFVVFAVFSVALFISPGDPILGFLAVIALMLCLSFVYKRRSIIKFLHSKV